MITSLQDLEQQLKSQFELKAMVDIGEFSRSPNGLFKLLHKVYQPSYQPNDRIVFYTSHTLPEKFLKHLYESTNYIDISNWFVLICGPAELEARIVNSCQQFSSDPVPFQFHSVDLLPTQGIDDKFLLPDTMCAIPWTNLEIQTEGTISPCCMTTGVKLGNINSSTLEQAFNSKELQSLRNSLRSGERPDVCKFCWKVEEKNLTSIRMHNIKRLKKDLLLEYLDQPKLATLDLKFNNTCNFKCRICDPTSSSLFALESHKFRGIPLVVQDNWSESKNFVDQMKIHLSSLHNIDMYGGEPFLVKKFKQVLELAVEKNYAKNIRLHYNSNGSIWPDEFIPYWKHFKNVDIHFSIDAVEKQFELQRGGKWEEVEDNILRLKDLGLSNLSISLMPTVGAMNVYYIDQVYDWATKHGFQVFVSHARGSGLELGDLTREAKDLVIKKFKDHPWSEMQHIIKVIQEIPDNNGEEFRNKIKWFDEVRKEDFSESHSEIANAMGYVYNKNL